LTRSQAEPIIVKMKEDGASMVGVG